MLDIKYIRQNAELVKKGAKDKRIEIDIDHLLVLDEKLRSVQAELEELAAERNRVSKLIPKAASDDRQKLIEEMSTLKQTFEEKQRMADQLKPEFDQLMLLVPQPARSDVPVGKDDSENVEIKKWSTPPNFTFAAKTHIELGELNDIIDIERGVKLSGSRSYILKGDGARLEQAVMRFVFDFLCERKYTPFSIPVMVREHAMEGTGYFPTGRDQAYLVERDQMALIGTSEVALASLHSGEIVDEESLPLRFMAQSSCFRREAGSYGQDTKGLYRVHQFQKIEQVIISKADEKESEKLHEELLTNAELILQALELPYRVVYVCTGDLGQGQLRKHDIETWMPSRGAYGETHSCSTFHEFQAQRLKIRYKDSESKKNTVCHTLNNTAIATPRVLISLLEIHQNEDGSINIPKVLQPYMGGQQVIKK